MIKEKREERLSEEEGPRERGPYPRLAARSVSRSCKVWDRLEALTQGFSTSKVKEGRRGGRKTMSRDQAT